MAALVYTCGACDGQGRIDGMRPIAHCGQGHSIVCDCPNCGVKIRVRNTQAEAQAKQRVIPASQRMSANRHQRRVNEAMGRKGKIIT